MRVRLGRIFALIAFLSPLPAFGSGFALFEGGGKAVGMASAFAATADDPSAIFYNVAGIAHLRQTEVYGGATAILFGSEFRGDPDSPFPGGGVHAAYEDHTFVIPNLFLVVPFGENVTFGIGQFSPFGLRTDWENGERFPGRFISQDANLKTASVQPSVAIKTSDGRFAFGAGLEYRAAHVSLERNTPAFNPFTGRIADVAHTRLDSDWDSELGWNVGFLYKPDAPWRFGISYRAPMDIDFDGEADITQISTGNPQFDAIVATQLPPDQDISTTISFPGFLHIGIATTIIPTWTIELDAIRNDWSQFEDLVVEFKQTPAFNLDIEQGWEDTFSYRLGANHPVTDNWEIRLGALYDENPQPVERVGPLLPDADRIGVIFGLGFNCGPYTVDFANFLLNFKDRSTEGQNADNFNGTYETRAHLITLNFGYRF